MLQLKIQIGEDQPEQVFEIDSDLTTIGRHQDNTLRIKNDYLSAFHAEIVRDADGAYQITDLDSFNGTFVNGLRVKQSAISAGDALKLGFLEGHLTAPGDDSARGTKPESEPGAATATQPTVISLDQRGVGPDKPDQGKDAAGTKSKHGRVAGSPVSEKPTKSAARAARPQPGDSRPVAPVAVAPAKPAAQKAKQAHAELPLNAVASETQASSVELEKAQQRVSDLESDNARLAKQASEAGDLLEKVTALKDLLTSNEQRLNALEAENVELAEIKRARESEVEALRSTVDDFESKAKKAEDADAESAATRALAEERLSEIEALTSKIAEAERRGR